MKCVWSQTPVILTVYEGSFKTSSPFTVRGNLDLSFIKSLISEFPKKRASQVTLYRLFFRKINFLSKQEFQPFSEVIPMNWLSAILRISFVMHLNFFLSIFCLTRSPCGRTGNASSFIQGKIFKPGSRFSSLVFNTPFLIICIFFFVAFLGLYEHE